MGSDASGFLPPRPGTYVLVLRVPEPAELRVGGLGRCRFPAGFYAYVGSAFGPGGLAARIAHHLASPAAPHWHLDYLRPVTRPDRVWLGPGGRHEHLWARALAGLPGAEVPAPRFGATDCRCGAHLFRFPRRPRFRAFRREVAPGSPHHARLRSLILAGRRPEWVPAKWRRSGPSPAEREGGPA